MTAKILFMLLILLTVAHAEIINVPDDFETIHGAISESEDGDTVLVQPGEYVENIVFGGKAITVASLFLLTRNDVYIDSTIIDGNEHSSVVRFDSGEDENSLLTGFTLTNGSGSPDLDNDHCGGGIHCRQASPTLSHLKITENEALEYYGYGGGVFVQSESSPIISYCEITNNIAARGGGGLYISRESNPIIRHTLIAGNTGGQAGGGIGLSTQCNPQFINVTYINNDALDFDWDIYIYQVGNISFKNCIILPNNQYIQTNGSDTITVSYSDVLCDQEDFIGRSGVLIWDDSNINEDPEFMDEESVDYHLNEDSPCIDAGDPDSPDDPDGTRSDMGAYPFLQGSLVIEGYVLNADNNEPFDSAKVTSSFGVTTSTDTSGFWRLSPARAFPFSITASKEGFHDSTVTDIELELDDTLDVTIGLLHSEFTPSEGGFTPVLNTDDSTEFDFSINNTGNGTLTWQAEKRLAGEAGVHPWESRRSYNTGVEVGDTRLEGVVFINDRFYVSGSNIFDGDDDENMIYALDRNGHEIDRFSQPGESHFGMRDLAWDGELIWGCDDEMIIGFSAEGDSIISFESPEYGMSTITWDFDREMLWIARRTGRGIYAYNIEGNCQDSLSRCGFRLYGLAYWQDDPDGYNLYILHSPDDNSQLVHKMNTETGDTMFVALLEPEDGGEPRGSFITNHYDPWSWVFINISNNGGYDRIDIWQVESNLSWFTLDPIIGEVEAESSQDLTLSIFTEGLPVDFWEGELVFSHNAAGGETILPVTLTIRPDAVEEGDNLLIPDEFAITSIYPNPFNASVTIKYNLNLEADVTLRLFDVTGREVMKLVDDVNQAAGNYSTILNGNDLPAGLYLLKLETGYDFSVRKIVLMP